MPSIYITEAELEAISFCAEHVSSAMQSSTDAQWNAEAETHVNAAQSLEQKVRNALSGKALKKALKSNHGQ